MNWLDIIEKATDTKVESVTVPEWGVTLYVKTLNSVERSEFECEQFREAASNTKFKLGAKKKDSEYDSIEAMRNTKTRLLSYALCDESGKSENPEKVRKILDKKSSKIIDDLYEIAARLNGLRKEDIEEIAGN